MKRLILIKQSPAIQLGHLYEHIFCSHVDTLLYEHHLFPDLDYTIAGKTYYGGIISVDLELYTDKAIALTPMISALKINLDETIIATAASQILAEREEPLASTGYDDVKRALESLDVQPWQNIDDVELIDIKDIRKKTGPFFIAEGKSRPAQKLTTGVYLDATFAKKHRELMPLFRQFAWLITSSLQGVLADTYGYFSFNEVYRNSTTPQGVLNTFKVGDADDIEVNLSEILETCFEVVRDLQQYGAFDRYMEELRKTSYYNHPNLALNLERLYEETHVFIGPKGWKKIATEENRDLLLEHTFIEIRSGRNKVSRTVLEDRQLGINQ